MKLDNLRGSGITKLFPARSIDYLPRRFAPLEIISIEREIILLCPPPSVSNVTLFHSLLNRGAANNTCYPPANCQQREITILSSRSLKIGLFSLISEV